MVALGAPAAPSLKAEGARSQITRAKSPRNEIVRYLAAVSESGLSLKRTFAHHEHIVLEGL